MLSKLSLLAYATQISLIAALGTVTVANRCSEDMWVWSVNGTGSSGPFHVPARRRYVEDVRECPGCGVSIKVSRTNELLLGEHTQFEYAIRDNVMYYDISLIDCVRGNDTSHCPGHNSGLEIYSTNEERCDTVTCPENSYCPTQAYYVPKPLEELGIPEPVYGCKDAGAGADLVFVLCQNQDRV